jgi:hypothetical protein
MVLEIGGIEFKRSDTGVLSPAEEGVGLPNPDWLVEFKDEIADYLNVDQPALRAPLANPGDWAEKRTRWHQVSPWSTTYWHTDHKQYKTTALVNPWTGNERGATLWAPMGEIIEFIRIYQGKIILGAKPDAQSHMMEILKRMDEKGSPVQALAHIRTCCNEETAAFVLDNVEQRVTVRTDWEEYNGTAFIFDNRYGIHRGAYRDKATPNKKENSLYRLNIA